MKSKIFSILASALFVLSLAVFIITFSIGLPIYVRPFYYSQIENLDIPERTGMTVEQIKEGYDEVLDYLVLPNREFGTGDFAHSEEGASHFADCKVLFDLNLWAFIISSVLIAVILLLTKFGLLKLEKPKGLPLPFWTGLGTLALFILLGGLCALDFDKAFVIFHSIFFPGKDNWMFNSRLDEIILAMPSAFFMRCAILIASSIILVSLLFVLLGIKFRDKKNKL